MHADLSRWTYRPEWDAPYLAVLAQQGRVQLDADLNEQALLQLRHVSRLGLDVIGTDGAPRGAAGFEIAHVPGRGEPDDLTIGPGRFYFGGIPVSAARRRPLAAVPDDGPPETPEEPPPWTYWTQPHAYRDPDLPDDRLPRDYPYVVYLKLSARAVTAVEDPALREVALGSASADTAARITYYWQVLAVALDLEDEDPETVREAFRQWAERDHVPRLAVRARRDETDDDPCLVRPDASYRGPENQLYRVEIHAGGGAEEATFKWSRENGSVTFAVESFDGTWVQLDGLGGDAKLDLSVGDWVEVVDTAYANRQEPLPLLRVEETDLPGRRVRLSGEPDPRVGRRPGLHPFLRRWDHTGAGRRGGPRTRGGAIRIEPGRWTPLEDGVEVYFPEGDAEYRTGDFWMCAARTVTGDVEWPRDDAGRPLLKPCDGDHPQYAPLALVTGDGAVTDLRRVFAPLTSASADPSMLAPEETASSAAGEEDGEEDAPRRRTSTRRRTTRKKEE